MVGLNKFKLYFFAFKRIIMFFNALIVLLLLTLTSRADTYGDFGYEHIAAGVSITNYTGSAAAVGIPDIIDNTPVVKIGDYAFAENTNLVTVEMGVAVHELGENCFKQCSSLETVEYPESLTDIGNSAFYQCHSLRSFVMSAVTNIDDYAFSECYAFDRLILGNEVTHIGYYAFFLCDFSTITIPPNVTNIEYRAFCRCNGLESAFFEGPAPNGAGSGIFDNAAAGFTLYCRDEYAAGFTNATSPFAGYTVDPYTNLFEFSVFRYDETITITNYPDTAAVDIMIPDTIVGKHVWKIKENAFEDCAITSVVIYDNIERIGDSAFQGCVSLTNATVTTNCYLWGDSMFSGCSSLEKINSTSLSTITEKMFDGCSSLKQIDLHNSYFAGQYAFRDCTSLTNVIFQDDLPYIPDFAFYNCLSLANLNLPQTISSIGQCAFYKCSGLTSVTIPTNTTTINIYAFLDCSALANLEIGVNVSTIGQYAFGRCHALQNVFIPASVTSMGSPVFNNCSSLTTITVSASNTHFSSEGGVLFDKAKSRLLCYGSGVYGGYSIPDTVTTVAQNAFDHCIRLTNITIPDSVTNIASSAFVYCTALTDITIPDSVTEIGIMAFSSCANLKHAKLSSSLTYINIYAFYKCPALTSIEIPASVTYIGDYAFGDCDSLTKAFFLGAEPTIEVSSFKKGATLTVSNFYYRAGEAGWSDSDHYPDRVRCTAMTPVMVPQSWIVDSLGWTTNFGDVACEDAALDDQDGDGAATWEEWVAGTDPNVTTNRFAITDLSFTTTNIIKWHSVSERTYNVFVSTNLNTGWNSQSLVTVTGDGSEKSVMVSSSSAKHTYYRIEVEYTP